MINLAKLTYLGILGAGVMFGARPEIAGNLASFSSLPGATLLSFPDEEMLPSCVGCDNGTTWGPVVVADFIAVGCQNNTDGRIYLQQNLYKTKYVCNNGSWWKCERLIKKDAACDVYTSQNCPDNTCSPGPILP